jgi:hypothetical protein
LVDNEAWSLQKRYKNLSPEEATTIFYKHARDIFFLACPYDGALNFFKKVKEAVDEMDGTTLIVTKQNPVSGVQTLKWLAYYELLPDAIYILQSGESKLLAKCDILVDDNLENLQQQDIIYGGAICKERTWNSEWPKKRYSNYAEIIDEIKKEKEKRNDETV